MTVSLILCDRSADMVQAWKHHFPEEAGIKVVNQNILTVPADALAVPANAFGFTDGGVDTAISMAIFDLGLQDQLRSIIMQQYSGELLVGQALVIPTNSARMRRVIVAPTMRVPGDVSDSVNAYLAMRAILMTADAHNRAHVKQDDQIRTVVVPGLCTGVGKMAPQRAAYQMWMAYRTIVLGDTEWSRALDKQVAMDKKMRERA